MKCLTILDILLFITIAMNAQNRIHMDGDFSDWKNISPLHFDSLNDQDSGAIDFGRIWITNDDKNLYIRIEIGEEQSLQNNNEIKLYIDTDNNPVTGKHLFQIGVELEWTFGTRNGYFDSVKIYHDKIGLVTSPTVTSKEFEIAIQRDSKPDGVSELFSNDTISILFESTNSEDIIPNSGKGVVYIFSNDTISKIEKIPIEKEDSDFIRIMTYNVLFDNFFKTELTQAYSRIFESLQPDIIGFEEIYDHNADETLERLKEVMPSGVEADWYSAKADPDIILVSRFPIVSSYYIPGTFGQNNGAFIVDLQPKINSKLLVIVAHPPCCNYDMARQNEIDAIMAFIRDAKTDGGIVDIDTNTPIIIIGDMNLVGKSQQLRSFLSGEIIDTVSFGSSFRPDWDKSDLQDLIPRHNESSHYFTWYDNISSFSPGRLDYIIYTNSIMKAENGFVLFTPGLSQEMLDSHNLEKDDVIQASDHLPVVADFSFEVTNGIDQGSNSLPKRNNLINYPNPFNNITTVYYYLIKSSLVQQEIFDINGRLVKTLSKSLRNKGRHSISWDGKNNSGKKVNTGLYIYSHKVDGKNYMHKLVLIR